MLLINYNIAPPHYAVSVHQSDSFRTQPAPAELLVLLYTSEEKFGVSECFFMDNSHWNAAKFSKIWG